jgi:glycerol-3-phosphate dehydrogenase
MIRKVSALANKEYDLVIIGGGIFGVCAAWDAVLRGLSVALIERGDFAHATSANCFKMVHGGIRYLQHLDFFRVRESSYERNVLLRIAPHLVHPLAIVVPTYGHRLEGKELLCAGLLAYAAVAFGRNRKITDPQKRIPIGRVISREACLAAYPGLRDEGLTGGVTFYDAQMHSPARLALAFLKSAVDHGAEAANYVEATGFGVQGNRVTAVRAHDRVSGDQFEIRGKVVLNAAGPWAEHLLRLTLGVKTNVRFVYSRDTYFVVARRLVAAHALALRTKYRDPDAVFSRGTRHLFLVPWNDSTLVGVWHRVYTGDPNEFTVTAENLQGFINDVNEAWPLLALSLRDVSMWNAGLVLLGDNQPGTMEVSYGKRSQLIDHERADGIKGLVTMVGVRYTTARGVAERAIDLVFKKLGKHAPGSQTDRVTLHGGDIGCFEVFARAAAGQWPRALSSSLMPALLRNHGSAYREVLKHIAEDAATAQTVGKSSVTRAEVIHAVRKEMAQTLADVVFRRTDLGTAGNPGAAALKDCADLMGSELGWNVSRVNRELLEVKAAFPHF